MTKAKTKIKPRATIGSVPVWCAYDKIVDCVELVMNPKNPNTHPAKQIELLGKIISKTGWRDPITVSKRSGFIVKGHGRLEAAFKAGIEKAPVDYQDYESEAAEHADMVADNRLAELASLDDGKLSELMAELSDFDIDIELTGFDLGEIKDLIGLVDETGFPNLPDGDKTPFQQMTFTLHDTQAGQVTEAVRAAKAAGPFVDTKNENSNGNALARICETYLTQNG